MGTDNELITRYLEWLENNGKSPATIRNRECDLNKFAAYLVKVGSRLQQATPEKLEAYHNKRLKEVQIGAIFRSSVTLRSFYEWCKKFNIPTVLKPEDISVPKLGKRLPRAVDAEVIKKVIEAARERRDKALIRFLYYTGVRVQELADLNRGDISFRKRQVKVRGKGNKERVVFFTEEVGDSVKEYLAYRKDSGEPLFADEKGNRLTARRIEQILQEACERAGIGRITPHQLRHSIATHLFENGAEIPYIRDFLGHEDIRTTMIYTEVSPKRLQEKYDQHVPKGI